MKRFICVILSLLLISALTVFANAVGADRQAGATPNSNCAVYNTASGEGATITGKAKTEFSFNGDSFAYLMQDGVAIYTAELASDGTYSFENVASGIYSLKVDIPGWTNFKMFDIDLADDDEVSVYETTIYAGDVNKDGVVSVDDISTILLTANYASATGDAENKGADVDHDGTVGVGDIAQVLLIDNFAKDEVSTYYINNGWSQYY